MRTSTSTRGRRATLLVLAAAALTVLAATAGALAADRFGDVSSGNDHAPGIGFLADTGVTLGCAEGAYCPSDAVTRAQMATFMHRLSGQAPGVAPSVDAATLQGMGPDELQSAASARVLRDHDPVYQYQHSGMGAYQANYLTVDLDDHCGDGTTTHQVMAETTGIVWLDGADQRGEAYNRVQLVDESHDNAESREHWARAHVSTMAGENRDRETLVNKRLLDLGPGVHELESIWSSSGLSYDLEAPTLYATVYGWSCGS